jgi:hypothetical protein
MLRVLMNAILVESWLSLRTAMRVDKKYPAMYHRASEEFHEEDQELFRVAIKANQCVES